MKRLIFEEDHEMFRDSVRKFMQVEVGPNVEKWREAGICDKGAFIKAGEQGLLCMWAEEKYGGLGISDFRFEQIVIEETMRHGDLSLFLSLHSRLVGPYIGHLGSEALKQRLLPLDSQRLQDLHFQRH
jgi:acyl-CoA dehydrogenase